MKNLELKARIADLEAAVETAKRLAGSCRQDMRQTDTYFQVHEGRLKLREYGNTAELIFYNRPDTLEAKYSDYTIASVEDARIVKEILARGLGIRAVVKKHRRVFILDNTRIHIDDVESLGTFLEFEVVFDKTTTPDNARATVEHLMTEFRIADANLVEGSYCELLEEVLSC